MIKGSEWSRKAFEKVILDQDLKQEGANLVKRARKTAGGELPVQRWCGKKQTGTSKGLKEASVAGALGTRSEDGDESQSEGGKGGFMEGFEEQVRSLNSMPR